ncbi:hypothetical protein CK218_19440 [Mesorhizobium sp. WSM3879]|uniref:cupin domain-containing protein n=1 Tax=Mesorhizobium sp. WSM3879 TaxID=2029406 RepID=UPI000BAFA164|nr:cupin domain-containing protein [Mesorhizobium sp. WSM3879]PBB79522.1 hypothetical protein CK218_19440 [Mesorhizobium sp. WSM3879]
MKSAFRYLMFAAALLSPAGMNAVQAADAQMPLVVARPREPSITTSTSETSRVNGQSGTVLHVNATKPGLHAVLLRLEPHKRVMPLSHPDSRFATILSGTFHVAFGDTYDATKLKALPPGGIYTEPA